MSRQAASPIAILGAGHTGTAAAFRATARGLRVSLVEAQSAIGGVGGSFDVGGVRCDFGSHRLNTECPPRVLEDLRSLLGDDLLSRPKRSRLWLRGRWIRLPMNRAELMRLPPAFLASVAGDAFGSAVGELRRALRRDGMREVTYPEILESDLGGTLCREFYFPYVEKAWGLPPSDLDVPRLHRRRSSGLFMTMVRNGAFAMLGRQAVGAHQDQFLYPRAGYGQIPETFAAAAVRQGAELRVDSRVTRIAWDATRVRAITIERDGSEQRLEVDSVWSTLPLSRLVGLLHPAAPEEIRDAAAGLTYRSMVLAYIILASERFTDCDTHFIPVADIPITRISEPKNYRGAREPSGRTVLCVELPCALDDETWRATDEALAGKLCHWFEQVGLPIRATLQQVVTRRLKVAYPVYRIGTQERLRRVEGWLQRIPGLVTLGLQGLFSHDDSHHVIDMAYTAVDCVDPDGRFDAARWEAARPLFEARLARFLRSMNGISL